MRLISSNHSQHEFSRRLHFEELLSDISTIFINTPAEQIDGMIESAQQKICQHLGFDLSALWQWLDMSRQYMALTHLFSPPDGPKRPNSLDAMVVFPWTCEKLLLGKPLVVSTDTLPSEAFRDRESRLFYGVKTSIVFPLASGGRPIFGFLSFDTLYNDCSISESEVTRLELVAQIFANVLTRKTMEENLRLNQERLSLAADSAEAGLWDYDSESKSFWITDRNREIFEFKPDEPITLTRLEKAIHPEDLSLVREAMHHAFSQTGTTRVEYRIQTPSGREKWLQSAGCPQYDTTGRPVRLLGLTVDISGRKCLENRLKRSLEEVESLRQQLENENIYLREDLKIEQGFEQIIGNSNELQAVLAKVRQVADTGSTVLIQGETGVGKELIAQAIHQLSDRRKRLMVTVNCAALPAALIESELFGREKGAFTGALSKQMGRFELANNSTLFLDEIAEMPLETQAKLLRVLEDGRFERLGSPQNIKVDVRVIAATNRDLAEEVEKGRFRKDLYFRLSVFPITVPPLRERVEDIPLLVWKFIYDFEKIMGKKITRVTSKNMETLTLYPWPGNVRELRNVVERAMIVSTGNLLDLSHLELAISPAVTSFMTLEDLERKHLQDVVSHTRGKIKGPGGAAELLRIHPSTLYSRMRKLGVKYRSAERQDEISTQNG